jgi:hypothetical protein
MRKIIQIFIVSCLLSVVGCFAQINSDSLILVYTQKMQKYLDKDGKASEVFSFTKKGIEVYAPATDTSQKKFEFLFNWNDLESYKKIKLSKPIGQLKIAIDPGHIAGNLETAKMEKKWVEMKKNPAKGIQENITLIEGELTLVTAKILKKKLEAEGAIVMLTRDQPNVSAFGIDFIKWKDSLFRKLLDSAYVRGDISFEEKNFLVTKANDTEIFRRFFLQEDLRERARKINEFHPDLTLVIHYNVDETNTNWNKPTKKDFNMAFVGGSFADGELEKSEARNNFLRLLLTDDIEQSIEFSKYIVESLVRKTGVPAALDSNAIYLRDNCMKTKATGVFCRNLALTRMIKGTLCYAESLYQDNINECKALSKKEIIIDNMKTSRRVEQVAEAYFEGIMNYVEQQKSVVSSN